MKTIITAAAALFAANVGAADVYHGLERGNTDLSGQRLSAEDFTGVQPSIGDSVDRYHGWPTATPTCSRAMAASRPRAPVGPTST